jgi:uncharacterized protein YlxW (UPF0749 family)
MEAKMDSNQEEIKVIKKEMKEVMKTVQAEMKVTEKMEDAISSILSKLEGALEQQGKGVLVCVDQRTLKENRHSVYAKLKCP